MLHPATVCPQVQQPLHIDTDINYSLDMSKFPGLDDPCHVLQPALLIATPDTISNYFHHCGDALPPGEIRDTDNASSICSVNYSRNMGVKWDATSKFPDKNIGRHIDTSSGHILEDLLTAIDTYTNGLLERLITIPECAAPNRMMAPNRNTMDLSHGPVIFRNYQQSGEIPHGYFHGARYVQTNTPVCRTGFNGLHRISDCVSNLQSLSTLKNNTRYKRKRTQDGFESDIRKRQCTVMDTMDAGHCYGYAGSYLGYHQLPTFTSIVT
ncbi:uncharacterized protein LOC124275535 [Haliotis rubra]|uniref:uncharacterized protein LOC124275535 n=1 Tax=Haliotis rubra TaxID=36100 RepID=UPI001EE62E1B|nr:uncharacterized protein LOC124275535 [Haliotis rubra]